MRGRRRVTRGCTKMLKSNRRAFAFQLALRLNGAGACMTEGQQRKKA
jgi:hypothetical protein